MNPINKYFANTIVNINGKIIKADQAQISIFDRGFLFGDSIYEVTMTEKYCPLFIEEHLDRLWNSASLIAMPLQITREQLMQELRKIIHAINVENTYLRMIITRGVGPLGLDPGDDCQQNLIIVAKEFHRYPAWWYQQGVSVTISSVIRNHPKSIDPNAKSGNYLNNVMAYLEAKKKNYLDAIMVNRDGFITEGTTNNVWYVKNNIVYTPNINSGLLKGITREQVLNLCHDNNINYQESAVLPQDFLSADECFLTSSTKGIVPIVEVDNQKIGSGKVGNITKKLINLYQQHVSDYITSASDYFLPKGRNSFPSK